MKKLFHDKILPIGKQCAFAIILAGLVAFGAVDFAHLFLPEEWMKQEKRFLEWAQFGVYLVGVGIALWKWRSIKAWCNALRAKVKSGENWETSDMIWTGLAVMGVVGFAPLLFPNEWIASDASILKRLQFAAYLVGGGFLVWQLRISNRRASAAEKNAQLVEKGNITERFKSAIEFLARTDDPSVQIGGIYTLYHVAKEAEEYKEAVLKILLAHLRQITAGKEEPVDRVVIAIWDTLFAREDEEPLFEKVDLSYVNLKKIGFGEINLYSYNLSTICKGVDLDITDAYFGDADLSGANLALSFCERTIFNQASCVRTFFRSDNFQGAEFIDADLTNADFLKSNITAQQLLRAKTLYGAKLPPEVHEEIMRERPRLLDKPAEEE